MFSLSTWQEQGLIQNIEVLNRGMQLVWLSSFSEFKYNASEP